MLGGRGYLAACHHGLLQTVLEFSTPQTNQQTLIRRIADARTYLQLFKGRLLGWQLCPQIWCLLLLLLLRLAICYDCWSAHHTELLSPCPLVLQCCVRSCDLQ